MNKQQLELQLRVTRSVERLLRTSVIFRHILINVARNYKQYEWFHTKGEDPFTPNMFYELARASYPVNWSRYLDRAEIPRQGDYKWYLKLAEEGIPWPIFEYMQSATWALLCLGFHYKEIPILVGANVGLVQKRLDLYNTKKFRLTNFVREAQKEGALSLRDYIENNNNMVFVSTLEQAIYFLSSVLSLSRQGSVVALAAHQFNRKGDLFYKYIETIAKTPLNSISLNSLANLASRLDCSNSSVVAINRITTPILVQRKFGIFRLTRVGLFFAQGYLVRYSDDGKNFNVDSELYRQIRSKLLATSVEGF